jgi:two-component system chemotaxis sensor kinase CheA
MKTSNPNMERFREAFREEAKELLVGLEESLLSLEEDPTNADEISAVFRAMHTIKGSSSMFGFDYISTFTHDLENLFDKVRNGEIMISPSLISAMLECKDYISELLLKEDFPEDELESSSNGLLEKVFQAAAGIVTPNLQIFAEQPNDTKDTADKTLPITIQSTTYDSLDSDGNMFQTNPGTKQGIGEFVTYRIFFKPDKEIFHNGTRPLNLIRELKELGEISILPHFEDIPEFSKLDPEYCYTSWTMFLTGRIELAQIQDVFLFVQDTSEISIEEIDTPESNAEAEYKLGSILIKKGLVTPDYVQDAIKRQKKIGQLLMEQGVSPKDIRNALGEQEHVRKSREKIQIETSSNTIRVASEKLDSLVDLVGELVTLQARLAQNTQELDSPVLSSISEQLERLTSELRDSTMSVRMLPIGTTFSRFKRLVRDLSQELGKDIEFVTTGGETEVDKTVIDKLNDPLVHLIRNSIDHGIEGPEERATFKKSKSGTITLRAEHVGASVHIIVEDDGRGLDADKIYQKAIERGLIQPGTELSEEEIYQFITAPGFSTAEKVTQVSGRGVGMDVVRREIESLGGTLTISSMFTKGSRITLEIPLTLAIIEGLMTKTGEEFYVFPLSAVEECLEYQIKPNAKILEHRGEVLSLCDLSQVFEIPSNLGQEKQIVVIQTSEGRVGIIVDQVIGSHQTVVKSLGKVYKDALGISGATIMGDGSIALILEVNQIVKIALQSTELVST